MKKQKSFPFIPIDLPTYLFTNTINQPSQWQCNSQLHCYCVPPTTSNSCALKLSSWSLYTWCSSGHPVWGSGFNTSPSSAQHILLLLVILSNLSTQTKNRKTNPNVMILPSREENTWTPKILNVQLYRCTSAYWSIVNHWSQFKLMTSVCIQILQAYYGKIAVISASALSVC
jgi:hypothetical protein